jgi:hypothetical protein
MYVNLVRAACVCTPTVAHVVSVSLCSLAQMEFVACIGRLNPAPALTVVCELLSQCIERFLQLSALPAISESQAATVNEELYWLVSFAGYLIANKSSGEVPSIPSSLNALSCDVAVGTGFGKGRGATLGAVADPLIVLPSMVFRIMDAAITSHVVSPLTMSQLLWFVDRWVATYVMPDLACYTDSPLSMTMTRYGLRRVLWALFLSATHV